jgi:hypothetical protein
VIKVADFQSLGFYCSGFKSYKGFWILSCEEAIQLAYRMSELLLRCKLLSEIMNVEALEVLLYQ